MRFWKVLSGMKRRTIFSVFIWRTFEFWWTFPLGGSRGVVFVFLLCSWVCSWFCCTEWRHLFKCNCIAHSSYIMNYPSVNRFYISRTYCSRSSATQNYQLYQYVNEARIYFALYILSVHYLPIALGMRQTSILVCQCLKAHTFTNECMVFILLFLVVHLLVLSFRNDRWLTNELVFFDGQPLWSYVDDSSNEAWKTAKADAPWLMVRTCRWFTNVCCYIKIFSTASHCHCGVTWAASQWRCCVNT